MWSSVENCYFLRGSQTWQPFKNFALPHFFFSMTPLSERELMRMKEKPELVTKSSSNDKADFMYSFKRELH